MVGTAADSRRQGEDGDWWCLACEWESQSAIGAGVGQMNSRGFENWWDVEVEIKNR